MTRHTLDNLLYSLRELSECKRLRHIYPGNYKRCYIALQRIVLTDAESLRVRVLQIAKDLEGR